MHLKAQPPKPSEFARVSPEVDAIVVRAMQKKPQDRFPTAIAFLDALKSAVAAGSQAAAPQARAVGILIDIRTLEAGESSDTAMADVLTCLDIVEPALIEGGYSMVLQTGSALLGVKALPQNDPPLDLLLRTEAIALAERIHQAVLARPDADLGVHVNVSVHATTATVKKAGNHFEVEGGPIVEIGNWAPADSVTEVFVSKEAAKDTERAA